MDKILQYTLTAADLEATAGGLVNLVLKNCIRVTGHEISHAKFIPGGITADGRPVTVKDRINAGQTLRVILPESLSGDGEAAAPDLPESRIVPQPVSVTTNAAGKRILPEDPAALPIPVLYEDEDILVADKPAGQVVHPTHGHYLNTALNYIAGYYVRQGMDVIPRLVGRLDRETSGTLLIAKNRAASGSLQRQRADGSLVRTYLALVHGVLPEKEGIIDFPIGRDPDRLGKMRVPAAAEALRVSCGPQQAAAQFAGRQQPAAHSAGPRQGKKSAEELPFLPALTRYQVIEEFSGLSLMKVTIDTGRTHQIRLHMAAIGHPLVGDRLYGADRSQAAIGHPLVGDRLYGDDRTPGAPRTMLHAAELTLLQPFTGAPLQIRAELPEDFARILRY